MSAVTTILLIRMKRIIQTFYRADATEAGRAIVPSEYGIREDFAFRRLVQRGVLVAVNAERYYMDVEAETKYRKQRRTAVLVVLIVGLVIFILTWMTARK